MTGVLMRGGEDTQTHTWSGEDRGRDWCDAATSQGTPAAPGRRQGQKDPSREPPAGARPRDASIWGFWPSERGGSTVCCFASPVCDALLRKSPGNPGQPPNPPDTIGWFQLPLRTCEPPPVKTRLLWA